ncbi:MAG: glycerol-3-phosphate dehydrogenase [Hyphomicrobiaceae bacterium]
MRPDSPPSETFDLAVIGGGINGCGIAADAAGRGLSVLLLERDDLASGTSSASSKLIHGGLRYLEHYAFRLVAESLAEREMLLANAPHIIWPMRFVVPHAPGMRSRLLMRTGLLLYDNLARRRRIPGSGSIELASDPAGRALAQHLDHGFTYWDCWVDDARLVVLVALQAAAQGARVVTRHAVTSAVAESGGWLLTASDDLGAVSQFRARMLVNAAGPWAGRVAADVIRRGSPAGQALAVRLVKGSHIVVPRIVGADDAYLLQAHDGRVVFLLPFAQRFTLIGTTDVPYSGDPTDVRVSGEEESYLLGVANAFVRTPLTGAHIVWRFAGVRPLDDDGSESASKVSRDYRLALDAPGGSAPPLLLVVGGKVTTYRRLAEAAVDLLAPHAPRPLRPSWTAHAPLPGGDIPEADFEAFARDALAGHRALPTDVIMGLLRRHGTRAENILAGARNVDDLGRDLGGGLTEREARYLIDHEWAKTPADILWRRTKAGLAMTSELRREAEAHLASLIAGSDGRAT